MVCGGDGVGGGINKEELLFIKGDELEKLCRRTKCTIMNTPFTSFVKLKTLNKQVL